MGIGLERYEPVAAEGKDAGTDEDQAAVFADACQTSQAPPISAMAARANSRIERSTVMAAPYPAGGRAREQIRISGMAAKMAILPASQPTDLDSRLPPPPRLVGPPSLRLGLLLTRQRPAAARRAAGAGVDMRGNG
jgi:hypothetical protein